MAGERGQVLVAGRERVKDLGNGASISSVPAPIPSEPEPRVVSGALRRYRLIGAGQAITDGLCIFSALLLSYLIRFDFPMAFGYLVLLVTMPVLWAVVFRTFSLYVPQHLSAWEEFRRVVGASSLGMVLVIMTSFWSKASLSRIWVGLTWVLVLLLEFATRRGWRGLISRMRSDHRLSLRTLVIGAHQEGIHLARTLQGPGTGFLPVGFVTSSSGERADHELPTVGDLDDLVPAVYQYGVDCLFIASNDLDQKDLLKVAQVSRQSGAEIRVAAHMPDILSSRLSIQPIDGVITLAVKPATLTATQAVIKRAFDLVASAVGLLVTSPFLAVLAIGIKATSRGPVFFRQHRVTKGGHIFEMIKFRTMWQDADQFVADRGIDTSVPFFKLGDDDPRLTRLGAFLRKYSLDELPQLFNVLRGEMSLVGPRPLPAEQVAANLDLLGPRHEVPAGVTGWWQIQGRSEIEDPDEAVRMDLFYIENWSLMLDLYVLFKTIGAVAAKRGAY